MRAPSQVVVKCCFDVYRGTSYTESLALLAAYHVGVAYNVEKKKITASIANRMYTRLCIYMGRNGIVAPMAIDRFRKETV